MLILGCAHRATKAILHPQIEIHRCNRRPNMATREQPSTASTESAHDTPSIETSFIAPPGKVPEMISNTVVRVDKRIGPCLSAAQHRDLIQVTAYHLAERRGFDPGHEDEDWATAEILVIESSGLPVI